MKKKLLIVIPKDVEFDILTMRIGSDVFAVDYDGVMNLLGTSTYPSEEEYNHAKMYGIPITHLVTINEECKNIEG